MSEQTITGLVAKVNGPNGAGFYGINVNDTWYGAGKEKPACEEGHTVKFVSYLNNKGYPTMKAGSLKVKPGAPAAVPSRAEASSGGGGGAKVSQYQTCMNCAANVVVAALEAQALKLGTKANEKLGILVNSVSEVANGLMQNFNNEVWNKSPTEATDQFENVEDSVEESSDDDDDWDDFPE